MASGVEELLDMLFEMIDEAKNAPLSSDKCVIERDRALDLIDDIRGQFPMELAEARKVMANRNEMIASSKREAENIRKSAEDKARQIMAEDVITLQAKQRANEMIQVAEERSRELKRSANEYCEDALRRTEEAVAEAYDEIKKSRARFRAAAGATQVSGAGNGSGRPIYDAAADED
jgi:Skp family chaperone for outer membrane proteins